jgi:hypothetical protein
MNDIEDKKLKIEVLLEEFRTINGEAQLYTQETMKCFTYAAILIALYLGWGITGDSTQANSFMLKIQQYVPYGFVLLCVYFLVMAYIREGLMKYRGYLENKINQILEEDIMQWDTTFTAAIFERGYFTLGNAWYARVPTPPLFLGLLITMASLLIFTSDIIRRQTIVVLSLIGACAITALYIYFIYPKLIDRIYKQDDPDSYSKKLKQKANRLHKK